MRVRRSCAREGVSRSLTAPISPGSLAPPIAPASSIPWSPAAPRADPDPSIVANPSSIRLPDLPIVAGVLDH